MVRIKVNASSFVVDAICMYYNIKHLHPPPQLRGRTSGRSVCGATEDRKRKDDINSHTRRTRTTDETMRNRQEQ
jgi:hypothetical protein